MSTRQESQETIARLTAALRTLEERQRAGLKLPLEVTFFLAALDRTLTDEERGYIGMVFGACKELREEMTVMLQNRLRVSRGGVIAAMRAHLESTFTHTVSGDIPRPVAAYLDRLRMQVLAKAGRLC